MRRPVKIAIKSSVYEIAKGPRKSDASSRHAGEMALITWRDALARFFANDRVAHALIEAIGIHSPYL